MYPRRQAAIVGVYTTQQARSIERSSGSLQLEALKGAIDDAGLTLDDIDGVFGGPTFATLGHSLDQYWAAELGGHVLTLGGNMSGFNTGLHKTALAVAAGMADVVVHVHGKSNQKTGPGRLPIPDRAPRLDPWDIYMTGGSWPMWYGMWARRYMHEFGVTSEDLAQVAVTHRYHATLNPGSLMGSRGELSVEDVVSSRMIAEPLHLFDCALDNDGGWAIVVASEEVARSCAKKPVWILGGADGVETDLYMTVDKPWMQDSGSVARHIGEAALGTAGISHDDLDVANLYDCFTITMIRNLEELGFCKLGEGAEFFREGHTRLGGSIPCNTDGGLLSHSHNGLPHGFAPIELTRQLRGECGARQVPDAKIGLAFSQGASCHGACGGVVLASD